MDRGRASTKTEVRNGHLATGRGSNSLPPKSSMKFDGNLAEHFERFKQKSNIYSEASGAGGIKRASRLLRVIGKEVVSIYNSFHTRDVRRNHAIMMVKQQDPNLVHEGSTLLPVRRLKEWGLINIDADSAQCVEGKGRCMKIHLEKVVQLCRVQTTQVRSSCAAVKAEGGRGKKLPERKANR